jgi:hypothetical protein
MGNGEQGTNDERDAMKRSMIAAVMLLAAQWCLAQGDSAKPDSVTVQVEVQDDAAGAATVTVTTERDGADTTVTVVVGCATDRHARSGKDRGCRRWEIGVRTTGLNDFPGTVTVGWLPGPVWLLDLGLGGYYRRRPYGERWDIESGIAALTSIKHRATAGKFCDLYLGAGPRLGYDHGSRAAGMYPDGWLKTWSHRYDLSLSIDAAVRRVLTVWGRRLTAEIGCSPLVFAMILRKECNERYDRDNVLVDAHADWKPNEYSVQGALAASTYLGLAYRF